MPGPRADRLAARALARDKRIAAAQVKRIQRAFRAELRDVLAAVNRQENPLPAITGDRWIEQLGAVWVDVGEQVYEQAVNQIGAAPEKQVRQLVALVQQIVQRGAPATQVGRFVEEQAQGIITTSRRRVHTILREADLRPSQVREVSRALRRLYTTDFVSDRSARIALDQVLKASATFENAAAQTVAESTGREYVRVWTTQQDDRVRSAHSAVHGQQVALDEPFKVEGHALRFPRDPAGPAHLTANCRCWVEHLRL